MTSKASDGNPNRTSHSALRSNFVRNVPVRFFLILWLVGFALRLLYLYQIADNPFFNNLNNDPLTFDNLARQIASGQWIGSEVFFKAPFYPYFLAIIYKLFGHSYLVPRLIQLIAGSLLFIPVYWIGRHSFDEAMARLAAALTATYDMFIYFEGELLITSWVVLFNVLAVWQLYRSLQQNRFGQWLLAGILIGLSAIARPNILLFCPFIPLWLWFASDPKKVRPIIKSTLLLAIGCLLPVAPVTVRNYMVSHDFVLVSAQGGLAFQGGNNPAYDGVFAVPTGVNQIGGNFWEEECHRLAEVTAGRSLKPSEVSRHYFRQGWQYLTNDPRGALKLYGRKIHLLFHGYELGNNQDIYFFKQFSPVLRWNPIRFGWLMPLALMGIFFSFRSQWKRRSLLLVFSGVYSISILLFLISTRHRMPLVPFIILFAAGGLIHFYRWAQANDYRLIITRGIVFCLLLLGLNIPVYPAQSRNFAQEEFNLGSAYYRAGEFELARKHLNACLSLNPHFPRAHLNLGAIALSAGELTAARAEFETELTANPNDEMAWNNLGAVEEQAGRLEPARQNYRQAIAIRPTYREAIRNLARLEQQTGNLEEAYQVLQKLPAGDLKQLSTLRQLVELSLQTNHLDETQKWIVRAREAGLGDPVYFHYVGLIEQRQGNFQGALYFLQKAYEEKPEDPAITHDLAMSYLQLGQIDRAEKHFKKATACSLPLAESFFNLALIAIARNDTISAIKYWHETIHHKPDFEPAREWLERLNFKMEEKE